MNKVIDFIIKNKKIVIIACSVLVAIVVLFLVFNNVTNQTIDIDKVINIDNVNNKLLKGKTTKRKIASKYSFNKSNIKITNKRVKVGEMITDLMVLKSKKMDALILQGRYEILSQDQNNEESLPPLMQINEYMNEFRINILSVISNDININPTEETMYGESQYSFPLPEEESVYIEQRLYSLTYEVNNNVTMDKYDINYYMDGDYLVCELVKYFA